MDSSPGDDKNPGDPRGQLRQPPPRVRRAGNGGAGRAEQGRATALPTSGGRGQAALVTRGSAAWRPPPVFTRLRLSLFPATAGC